uniref:Uncharacterized mitochondrial protein AtMg00810-like n=1 Tax=Tanacetum cinerariifolium TaxID=118510 RepID=A0A699GVS7_TANCI|nr:uncharacterized mitochondrial protein AtMg00810-like [Tanacetum cinerariifolium]
MESLNSNSQEIELHPMYLEELQMHSNGMACFKGLESHLKTLYPISDFFVIDKRDFETAFLAFFCEEYHIFRMKMFRNLDQLQLQFERENLRAVNAKTCLEDFKDYTRCKPKTYRSDLLKYLVEKFIDKRVLKYGELWMKECEVKTIEETEKTLNEAIPHEHEIEKSFKLQSKDVQINPVQAVDANLVVTKSSRIESENNSSKNALSKSMKETQMQMQKERYQSVVRQLNAFQTQPPKILKPRFAFQVDVNNDLPKPITPHYLPKFKESVFVKPHHVMASGSSRNSSKKSSYLGWKSTGRIFNTVGLRWVPIGKIFTSSTTKADSEPPNGLKEDITNPYKCENTLNVSACTLNLDTYTSYNVQTDNLRVWLLKSSVPGPQLMTLRIISSGLVSNLPSPTHVASLVHAVLAPDSADSTGSPSSNTIDQDAPFPSTSQIPHELQSPIIPSSVEEQFHDIKVAYLDNDLFFGVPIPEPNSGESSSRDVIPTNVHSVNQPTEHLRKWTKDHPLDNVIGNPSRPIEAMQEELDEFERLQVWELIPRPDRVMIITLKWIFKVKLDDLGGVLKNKARLQISQSPRGIFINQSKYAFEIIKKYGMKTSDQVDTPMVENPNWMQIHNGYKLIQHIIVAKPTEKHLHTVKRIFLYLRGTINMGLWYSKDSCIALTAFADADHASFQDTRRSTFGSMQLLGNRLVSWSS